MAHAYGFGVEEEFFLADAKTRGTSRRRVEAFHAAVQTRMESSEREALGAVVDALADETASPKRR